MIRYILGFIGVIVCITLIVLFIGKKKKDKKNYQENNKKKLVYLPLICISILFTIFIPGSFHQVEAGQVAVVKCLGKVVGTRTPGTYFDFYLTNTYTYFDTTIQQLDINTASYSSDAQTMTIDMTIQFRIIPEKAGNILIEYTNMKSLGRRIEKVADDQTKSILSKYTAMKIIETRASISPLIEGTIKDSIGDIYYSEITAVNLTNINFTDEFEKAVEDKVVAEQQKEAAITKAEQELEVAKLNAEAEIEKARGDAESQKIIASASAEATALKIIELAKSLGYQVNTKYTIATNEQIVSPEDKVLKDLTTEEVVDVLPSLGVEVSKDENNNMIKITKSLKATSYSIVYDETHTKEDLNIIIDLIKYLEYLEKWDGDLPQVVNGTNGVDIIIPTPTTNTK